MESNWRLHFTYVVGILAAVIIALLTKNLAGNEKIVNYISFALTLSSILLALVAMVYAFVSNGALSQSIGGLHLAATDIRNSAASVDRLAKALESEVGSVNKNILATHDLVRGLANPSAAQNQAVGAPKLPETVIPPDMVSRSSAAGKLAMYIAAVSFQQKKPFLAFEFFEKISKENSQYLYGWMMSLDAALIVDIRVARDFVWTIQAFPTSLLEKIVEEADKARKDSSDVGEWRASKILQVDEFFKS